MRDPRHATGSVTMGHAVCHGAVVSATNVAPPHGALLIQVIKINSFDRTRWQFVEKGKQNVPALYTIT